MQEINDVDGQLRVFKLSCVLSDLVDNRWQHLAGRLREKE